MEKFIFFFKNYYLNNNFHPIWLFFILFFISIIKSTIIISSFFPPASIMIINGIIFSYNKLNILFILLAIISGSTLGSIISYVFGKQIKKRKILFNVFLKNKKIIDKIRYKLKKKENFILITSRFIAILRYIVPFTAGILSMNKKKMYIIFLISSLFWSIFYLLISKKLYFLLQ